ncbi:MAG: IS110 family transposase [Shimia sp.]|nr:IS110 family transposase [Shimia sp.]
MAAVEPRFVGMDLHRHDVVVGAVDAQQAIVLPPQRVPLRRFSAWAQRHLAATDQVAVEATTNTWALHDLLTPHVASIHVAHPQKVRWIAHAKVKHDQRDALVLARLLAANLLPEVWVPPPPVRQLRSLIVHRQHLTQQRRAAKNRLRGVLFRLNLPSPPGDLAAAANRAWWQAAPLNAVERLRVQHDLATLDHVDGQIDEVNATLAQLSVADPWRPAAPFLLQMPGIGLVTAMTILSAIGDIRRFPTPKTLVGYAGLGVSLYASGQTTRSGGITKQGRRELRTALIQAAWVAVRFAPAWQARFRALQSRKGPQIAITIIARKILVVIWHVLTHRAIDRNADPRAIQRAFLDWATQHRLATSQGLSRAQFVQQALLQIGLHSPA